MSVTYSQKRYVSVCVGCNLLFDTVRRDQLTCSSACRVKAHRSGALKRRRALAKRLRIPPGRAGHADAMLVLRPDLQAGIMADDEVSLDDVMPDLCAAFDRLVLEEMNAHNPEAWA